MLKQILAKLPRKSSSKCDSFDSSGSNSCNNTSNLGNGIQFTNSCTVIANRLNVVKRMSTAIFPASIVAGGESVAPHVPFKDVSNAEKQSLFVSKLNLCCTIYDFNDPDKDSAEKDLKRQVLLELNEFVASGSARFTESAISTVCKMCAVNLFRTFPPKYLSARGESEDEEPMFDPAWCHLQLVYDFFLSVIGQGSLDAKYAKKYVDHSFILKLLDLFDSEDPRERECLKSILHCLYGKFMMHRPAIRKAVSNIFYRFAFETERHNGIAELLEVFGSVISGFALPLKEEHRLFFSRALLPLHKTKSLGIYHQQLAYCVVQFIEKEQNLASVVITRLLRYWPVTSSQKQLMFISELEEILEMISIAEFEKIMVPLFHRIGYCLNSSHFQGRMVVSKFFNRSIGKCQFARIKGEVPCNYYDCLHFLTQKKELISSLTFPRLVVVAERAHFLWNNDNVLNLVMHNRHVIMPIIISALERNSQNHWNKAVLNLTQNVRKVFSEMDEELVLDCQGKLEEENSKSNVAAERRRLMWERLEIAANYEPVAIPSNISGLVKPATCLVSC
ncbi:hypothetical protein RND71_036556 [Anisodus tanguticus]|uniref:Serine/threonine protein phosphatase 2A regulatory subunit n=1 Tax=Anisodus tanguticus TaxID=243964 RepID=A0AAE1UUA0_9SOLA|nr:hypothetical protein RND71_036556 [Anisodus tanguticus]